MAMLVYQRVYVHMLCSMVYQREKLWQQIGPTGEGQSNGPSEYYKSF